MARTGGTVVSPPTAAGPTHARPVMLVTFDVPFDPAATTLAVDSAVESGQRLLVVNVSAVPIMPISMRLGYEYIETSELTAALRAPAELAASFAVPAELLRVASPRPLEALLQLVSEREPGLLVVGPDLSRMKRRAYDKAAKRIRDRATCLVWLAGPPAGI